MNGFLPLSDAPLCDVGSAIVIVVYQDIESGTIIAYVYAPKVAMLQSVSSSLDPSTIAPSVSTYGSNGVIKSSPLFSSLQGMFVLPSLKSDPADIGNFNTYATNPALDGSSISSTLTTTAQEGTMESWPSVPSLVKVNLI